MEAWRICFLILQVGVYFTDSLFLESKALVENPKRSPTKRTDSLVASTRHLRWIKRLRRNPCCVGRLIIKIAITITLSGVDSGWIGYRSEFPLLFNLSTVLNNPLQDGQQTCWAMTMDPLTNTVCCTSETSIQDFSGATQPIALNIESRYLLQTSGDEATRDAGQPSTGIVLSAVTGTVFSDCLPGIDCLRAARL